MQKFEVSCSYGNGGRDHQKPTYKTVVKHWPSEASQELPPGSSAKEADEERLGAGSVKSRWGKRLMVQEGSMNGDYQEDTRGALW